MQRERACVHGSTMYVRTYVPVRTEIMHRAKLHTFHEQASYHETKNNKNLLNESQIVTSNVTATYMYLLNTSRFLMISLPSHLLCQK